MPCCVYRDPLLMTAQSLSILAFVFSFGNYVMLALGCTCTILLQVVWCCEMNRCGLNTAATFASIIGVATLGTALFVWIVLPQQCQTDKDEQSYYDTSEPDSCNYATVGSLLTISALLWITVGTLVFIFANSQRFHNCSKNHKSDPELWSQQQQQQDEEQPSQLHNSSETVLPAATVVPVSSQRRQEKPSSSMMTSTTTCSTILPDGSTQIVTTTKKGSTNKKITTKNIPPPKQPQQSSTTSAISVIPKLFSSSTPADEEPPASSAATATTATAPAGILEQQSSSTRTAPPTDDNNNTTTNNKKKNNTRTTTATTEFPDGSKKIVTTITDRKGNQTMTTEFVEAPPTAITALSSPICGVCW